jgi:hypothetical protein
MDLIERTLSKEVHFYTFDELGPFQNKLYFYLFQNLEALLFQKCFILSKGHLKLRLWKMIYEHVIFSQKNPLPASITKGKYFYICFWHLSGQVQKVELSIELLKLNEKEEPHLQ